MDFFEQLPEIVRNKILSFLQPTDLARFSCSCKLWREYSNQDSFWHKFCIREGLVKFKYLIDKHSHPCVPLQSQVTVSPIYKEPEYITLEKPCKWRLVYMKAVHLIKNWRHGNYTVGPILKGHKGRVSAFDCDGEFIVSGSSDEKLVKVWSIEDSECVYTIKSQLDSINTIKIHKNQFILGGDDGFIRIYELSTGDSKKKIVLNDLSIMKIFTHEEKLIAVINDKSIRIWSLKTYDILQILRGHEDDIECLHFFNDLVVSGSWDKNIIIWNFSHGKRLLSLKGHEEAINCLKIKDKIIVSGSSDSTVRIWTLNIDHDSRNKNPTVTCVDTKTLEGHESDVYCLDFNDEYIVSGGSDSRVIVWNFHGELLHKLSGHLGVVRYIFMDDFKIVTGGDAKKIMIWDYKQGKQLNTLYRNPNRLHLMWINDLMILTASPENESNLTTIFYW